MWMVVQVVAKPSGREGLRQGNLPHDSNGLHHLTSSPQQSLEDLLRPREFLMGPSGEFFTSEGQRGYTHQVHCEFVESF